MKRKAGGLPDLKRCFQSTVFFSCCDTILNQPSHGFMVCDGDDGDVVVDDDDDDDVVVVVVVVVDDVGVDVDC